MCEWGNDTFVRVIKPSEPHGRTGIKVDACLAQLIEILNRYGIETMASCCGHGKTTHSYIRIHPKNITIQKFNDEFSVGLQFPYKGESK